MRKSLVKKITRLISVTGLGALLFYPFIFCPFRAPYIYCLICPVRCPWGRARGFFVLGILILNLSRRNFYCQALCPLGAIQDLQNKTKTKKFRIPGNLSGFLRYLILILALLVLLGCTRFSFLVLGGKLLLGLLVLILVASFFIQKFWCFTFCPFRTLSDTIGKIGKYLKGRSHEAK